MLACWLAGKAFDYIPYKYMSRLAALYNCCSVQSLDPLRLEPLTTKVLLTLHLHKVTEQIRSELNSCIDKVRQKKMQEMNCLFCTETLV